MLNFKKDNKAIKPILFIIAGAAGLILTGLAMLRIYKNTNSVKELIMPLIYCFIPFVASFLIFKFGMKGLINGNK